MDYLFLSLHLLAPILLPVLIMLAFESGTFKERLQQVFALNSGQSLISQRLFWLSLIMPVGLFLSFGIVCWSGFSLDLSQSGVSTFFAISAFPLALLSAAIPLGVVVASFHSTQQTAEQIKQATFKNNLEAYYLHRTEFFKHFERHKEINYLGVLDAKFVPHPLLYLNCSLGTPENGMPERDDPYFHKIDGTFSSAAAYMDMLFQKPYSDFIFNVYLCNACVCIYNLAYSLGLPEIYRDMADDSLLVVPPQVEGKKPEQFLTVGSTAADILAAFRYARDFYVSLSAFYGYDYPSLPNHLEYLVRGGKVFSLQGWTNVSKFKADLYSEYVVRHGFKVVRHSEIIPDEGLHSNDVVEVPAKNP